MSNREYQIKTYPNVTERTRYIQTTLGRYYRALMTKDFVFFCNYYESDENGTTIMFRRKDNGLELVSDNYFASVGLLEAWIDIYDGVEVAEYESPMMKDNWKIMIDKGILKGYSDDKKEQRA